MMEIKGEESVGSYVGVMEIDNVKVIYIYIKL